MFGYHVPCAFGIKSKYFFNGKITVLAADHYITLYYFSIYPHIHHLKVFFENEKYNCERIARNLCLSLTNFSVAT
jgi:hypothetical protein